MLSALNTIIWKLSRGNRIIYIIFLGSKQNGSTKELTLIFSHIAFNGNFLKLYKLTGQYMLYMCTAALRSTLVSFHDNCTVFLPPRLYSIFFHPVSVCTCLSSCWSIPVSSCPCLCLVVVAFLALLVYSCLSLTTAVWPLPIPSCCCLCLPAVVFSCLWLFVHVLP
jgi:hypothetical protein